MSGLDTLVVAQPASGSGPDKGYEGTDLRNAYLGDASGPCGALDGAGQAIGLFELDEYTQSDVLQFETQAGLPKNTVVNVPLDGISLTPSGGVGSIEVALDIDVALSMAPGARITVFAAPNNGGTDDSNLILSTMATTLPLHNQLSSSWFFSSDDNTDQLMEQLAAQGQSFFEATGDFGAYGPGTGALAPTDIRFSGSELETLVGGSQLTMNGLGVSYASETTWTSGGGGILVLPNPIFGVDSAPIPYYQTPFINAANGGSAQYRNIPDVSAESAFYDMVVGGASITRAGTSASTPLWAAFTALTNQQGSQNGVPSVGLLNPALYALAGTGDYTSAFNDINDNSTNSANGAVTGFPAVTGYDLATGLGSPKCGLIYSLVGGSTPPPPPPPGGPSVEISATETQLGPDVCVTGTGFIPGDTIRTELLGVPGRTAPVAGVSGMIKPDGSFIAPPQTTAEFLSICNGTASQNTVTVSVTERDPSGAVVGSASGTVPAAYWCSNTSVSTTFNGGCN